MTANRPRTTVGALLVVAALALVGCGASGSDDADDTTTTAEAAADETTTTAGDDDAAEEEAQERAESIELTIDDFPEGWSEAPSSGDDDDAPSPADECDPSFEDDSDELAEFANPDFTFGDLSADDGIQFSSETKVFVDDEAASAAMAPFADDEVLACIDEAFKDDVLGASQGNVVEGEFAVDDSYGETPVEEAVGASGEYTITTPDGSTAAVTILVAIVREGDLATQMLITSVGDQLANTDLSGPVTRIEELVAES